MFDALNLFFLNYTNTLTLFSAQVNALGYEARGTHAAQVISPGWDSDTVEGLRCVKAARG